MRKQRLKIMKQRRSMTAAAIIHSLIICWFLFLWWRRWSSLRSLVSIISLIETNRCATGLMLCPAAAAAANDDAVDVWSFVSSKSRMPHCTSDVNLIPFPSFCSTYSILLTSLFSTGSKLSSWPTWWPMTSLHVTSLRDTVFTRKKSARWPQM